MSFENTEKWLTCKRKKIATTQTIVECFVSLDSGEEIQKILSVLARSQVENISTTNDLVVNGKVVMDLIYLTTENKIGNITTSCPFEVKEKVETLDGKVFARSKVLEANIEEVKESTAKIVFVVEVSSYLLLNTEINKITSLDDDVCYKEEEETALLFVGEKNETVEESATFLTKEKVNKILAVESGVTVKDYNIGYNFVTVSGDVINRIVYTVDDEEKIYSTYVNETFKEEIAFENLPETSVLNINYDVVYDKVLTNISDGENENKEIKITMPIKFNISAFDERKMMVIKDLYSTKNEVNITTNSYEQTLVFNSEYFENKVEGSFTLSEENPRVDKLLTVGSSNVILSNSYVKDGTLTLEGVATATIIYLNDELGSVNSVQLEFPFVSENKVSFETEVIPNVNLTLTDVDVMVKKGREVYFDAKIKTLTSFYEEKVGAVISEVVLGDKLEDNNSQMDIYIANVGESVWSIAKSLKIPEEVLFAQNPELTDPIQETNNKITVYKSVE